MLLYLARSVVKEEYKEYTRLGDDLEANKYAVRLTLACCWFKISAEYNILLSTMKTGKN